MTFWFISGPNSHTSVRTRIVTSAPVTVEARSPAGGRYRRWRPLPTNHQRRLVAGMWSAQRPVQVARQQSGSNSGGHLIPADGRVTGQSRQRACSSEVPPTMSVLPCRRSLSPEGQSQVRCVLSCSRQKVGTICHATSLL